MPFELRLAAAVLALAVRAFFAADPAPAPVPISAAPFAALALRFLLPDACDAGGCASRRGLYALVDGFDAAEAEGARWAKLATVDRRRDLSVGAPLSAYLCERRDVLKLLCGGRAVCVISAKARMQTERWERTGERT